MTPNAFEHLTRSQTGEALPWLADDGATRKEHQDAFGSEFGWAGSSAQGAVVARELWDHELSAAEKRLAWRMASRPEELGRWLFAGVNASGLLPELAAWRASVRQRQLARELARPWFEHRTQSFFGGAGQPAPRKRASALSAARSMFWMPNPMGDGAWARLAGLLMSNFLLLAISANLALSLAKPPFYLKINNHLSGALPFALTGLMLASLFLKTKVLRGVSSLPLWLWARAQLPQAGYFHGRRMERAALAHWRAKGACKQAARALSSVGVSDAWTRSQTRANALEAAQKSVSKLCAVESGLDAEDAEIAGFRQGFLHPSARAALAALDCPPSEEGGEARMSSKCPWEPSAQAFAARDALLAFEKECLRVEASMSMEAAMRRTAQSERSELSAELSRARAAGASEEKGAAGAPREPRVEAEAPPIAAKRPARRL